MSAAICPRCQSPMSGLDQEAYCPRCAGRLLLGADSAGDAPDVAAGPGEFWRLGEFQLGAELGRGAMGVVYRARQPRLKRDVAVKVILASRFAGEPARKRFLAEAELAAQLDHPNIVPIYEVGETPDGPFYAMKLVEGGTLAEQLIRSTRREEAQISRAVGERRTEPPHVGCYDGRKVAVLLATVARAVHHAHQRGVLHRDLKPGNILLDPQGEPHVTDFGLARQMGVDSSLTHSGSSIGTPAYMSPEQARGDKGISTASDVWSLGAILYHLIAGRPPFEGDTAVEVMRKVMEEEPAPPRRRKVISHQYSVTSGPSDAQGTRRASLTTDSPITDYSAPIDRDLETICLKCLEKDPTRRYASALELAEDLERWLKHEPIRARPSTRAERLRKWVRRRPAVAALLALAVILFVTGAVGVGWQWRRANAHAAAAESALVTTREALWQANFDRARALRTGGRMGQRVETLKALRAAASLRPSPELREEAIAAFALVDLEDVGSWHPYATNASVASNARHGDWYAFRQPDGVVEIRRFQDGQWVAALTNLSSREIFRSVNDLGLLLTHDLSHYRIRNIHTGQMVFEMPAPYETSENHFRVSLSRDGRRLAYRLSKSAVAWRDLNGEGEAGRIEGLDDAGSLQLSPTAEWLAIHVAKGLEVWRLPDRTRLAKLDLPRDAMNFLWHPVQPLLGIGCEDRNAYVWDVGSGAVQKLEGHRREGVYAYLNADTPLVASTSFDDVLRLWNPFTGAAVLNTTYARPYGFSPDGQWLRVRNAQGLGNLKVHLPTECRRLPLKLGTRPVRTTFSPDGRFLLGTRDRSSRFSVWEAASGRLLEEMTWPGMKTARFLGERQLLTVSQAGIVLWTNRHAAEGWELAQVRTVDPLATPYADVLLNHDRSRFVATREGGGGGDVFEVATGQLTLKLRGQNFFGSPSFSPDGQWMASGYFDNEGKRRSALWIWSATNGSPVRQIPMGNCAAYFSPDGRWLLIAAQGGYLQYAVQGHPTTWPMTRSFPYNSAGFVEGPAAFSSDGALMALLADATVVRLLEAATGRELARFTPPPDVTTVERLHLSPDGRWLVADTDVGPFLWELPLIRSRLREMNLDWE